MSLKKRISVLILSVLALGIIASAFMLVTPTKSSKAITQPSAFKGSSLSFSGNTEANVKAFRLQQGLTGSPKTIEAFIKVPTTANEGNRYGVILGNFVNGTAANADCFDLEVYSGGNPRLYWYNNTASGTSEDGSQKGFSFRLQNKNIATNTWTHLAFVRDTSADKTYCYINGELAGTLNDAGEDFIPGSLAGSQAGNLSVGSDNRNLVGQTDFKATLFQGNIAYVSISSQIKSQAQVQDSMSKMASCTATEEQGNLLFLDYAKKLDYDGNGLDLSKANGYEIIDTLTAAPRTFEALIKVQKNTKLTSGRYGVIIGNFYSGDTVNNDCFDLEIHQNGVPRLFWHNGSYSKNASDGTPNGFDFKVSNVKVNTGEWVHLAFVRDMTADKTYCYINGSIVATLNEAGKDIVPGTLSGSSCGGLRLGMDHDKNAGSTVNVSKGFQGEVGYVALSSKSKSASEIRESASLMEKRAVNKEMTKSVADLLLIDKSTTRSYYRADKALESNPNTITATFKLPKAYAVGHNGEIFGTAALYASAHSYNLEINAKGHLCLVWNAHKSPNANPWIEFTSVDFRNGEWTNVAVVRDKTKNCFKLYVNGVHKESSSTATGVGSDALSTYAPSIGCNYQTSSNERLLFRGYIKDVAAFSTALSDTDIANFYSVSDKTKVSKTNYPSMMLNWVLSEKQQSLYYNETCKDGLVDYSGNNNNAKLCTSQHYVEITEETKDWFKAGDDEYTLIFMPDTQITVSRDVQYYETNANVSTIKDLDMTKTFQWMVDNKEAMNLSFVMHMGDLKHARGVSENWAAQNDWREWELISGKAGYSASNNTNGSAATSAVTFSSSFINGETFGFELLKEAGIPYTMILGNHDYNAFQMGEGTGRNADYFNYYFSSTSYDEKFAKNVVARYNRNHSDFAKNNNTMMNVVYEIDATPKGSSTPVKYLVVALEYGPDDDMIAWANEIVSQPQYSGHRVIVNTHAMMYCDGEFMSDTSSWRPIDYGFSKDANVLQANNGIDVYNKLIKGNDNMFMSSGGHVSQEGLMTRNDLGDFSNNVYSMLIDWQDSFNSRGDSLLLVAKVNEKTKKVTFRVYNPITNQFYCVENEEIVYDFSESLTREVKKDSKVIYDKNNATVGKQVEFSINKQSGCVYAPSVVDSFGNSIPVTQTATGYVFTMPGSKVTISSQESPISGITLPNSIDITYGDSIDLSQYLPSTYNYTFAINGDAISSKDLIISADKLGSAVLTVSIDGYGEYCSCTFFVEQIEVEGVTLPNNIELYVGDTIDLSQYLPNAYQYTITINGDAISLQDLVVSADKVGSAVLNVAIKGYGDYTSCNFVISEKPVPPSSSASSSSSSSLSSSSSIISSSSESSSSSSSRVSKSSNGTSATKSARGCGSSIGTEFIVFLSIISVVAVIIIAKKKRAK